MTDCDTLADEGGCGDTITDDTEDIVHVGALVGEGTALTDGDTSTDEEGGGTITGAGEDTVSKGTTLTDDDDKSTDGGGGGTITNGTENIVCVGAISGEGAALTDDGTSTDGVGEGIITGGDEDTVCVGPGVSEDIEISTQHIRNHHANS